MKLMYLFPIGLGVLCPALYYHQTQKLHLNKTREIYYRYQREFKALENDIEFLKQNQNQLIFLTKKGWFTPQNRLIGGTYINQWTPPLNAVRFKIEPEMTKEIDDAYEFKISKITIKTNALLDNHIYELSENIFKNFPGVLILRKLSIHRNENVSKTNPLSLNFVVGEIIFEWFSMGGRKDEG